MQRPIVSADPSRTGTHRPIGDTGLAQRADAPRRGKTQQRQTTAVPHPNATKVSSVNGISTNPSDVTPMHSTVVGATPPKKSHKLRNGIIAGAIILAIGGGIGAAYLNRSSIALFMQSVIPSNENTEDEHHWQIGENESAEMTISTGDTVVEVRKMLYDLGFASTADVLYEKLDEQNKMNSLQAGTYTLIGSETPDEIINRLTSGIKSPDGYIGINADKVKVGTDRGSEFDNAEIDLMLETFGIERSLSAKGCPYDNAVDESTNKILKAEFVYRESFRDLRDLQAKLSDCVHWYNNFRIHSTLGYMSPVEFRKAGMLLSKPSK